MILTQSSACALVGCSAKNPTTLPDLHVAVISDDANLKRTASGPQWQWPLENVQLIQEFVAPETRYSSGHRGIDLAAQAGDNMVAPAKGVVAFVGVVVDRPVLTIDHGHGVLSSYEPVSAIVSVGENVSAGQRAGVVDRGAHCSESCVHVGVRVNGSYVSPLLFFDRVAPAVLLPVN